MQRPALVSLALVGLAVLVNAPYLWGGFSADDFLLITTFERDPLPFSRWRGVWSATGLDTFDHLWWRSPDATGQFWRPLPSAIFEASLALFGRVAWPLHLVGLLAHGAVAAGLYLLVRKLAPGGGHLGLVAALVFLACEDHSMGVGWISTFTDMLSLALVVAGLLAHRAWLERRGHGWIALELLAFALALACKESAVLAPVLAVLMSAWMPRGVEEGPLPLPRLGLVDLLRRPVDWAPQAALVVAFLLLYKVAQLGGMNNLMYLDPLARPVDYLVHLVAHMPVMWLATLSPVPPSLAMFYPGAIPALALAGVLAVALWAWLGAPLLRRPIYAWGLAAYLLALLPQLGTDASERGLYQPWLGAAVLLAGLLLHLRDREARRLRLGAWLVAMGVVAPGALMSVVYPHVYTRSFSAPEDHTLTAVPHIEAAAADTVVFVTTAGMMDTLYPGGVLDYHLGPDRVEAWLLSSANARWTVQRVGARSLVLRADRPGWLGNMFARIVRSRVEVSTDPVVVEPFTATVLERTPDGRDALAVRFDLHGDALLLAWTDQGYRPLELGALPEGRAVLVTDNADVWASME